MSTSRSPSRSLQVPKRRGRAPSAQDSSHCSARSPTPSRTRDGAQVGRLARSSLYEEVLGPRGGHVRAGRPMVRPRARPVCVDPAGEGGGRARCRKRVSAVNQNRWRPAESQPTDVLIRVHRHWLQLHRNAHPVCGQPDSLQHGLPMGAPVEVQHGDLHAHVRMILHRRPAASPQRDLRRPQGHVLRWRTGQGSSGPDGRVRASHGPCHPPMPRGMPPPKDPEEQPRQRAPGCGPATSRPATPAR